ncbi:MAG: hypothetical protein AAGB26_04040 [Planctomycetota bacterium]
MKIAIALLTSQLIAGSPLYAEDDADTNDVFIGTWYQQPMSDQFGTSANRDPDQPDFVSLKRLNKDGTYDITWGKLEFSGKYKHDNKKRVLSFYSDKERLISEMSYVIKDEVLVLKNVNHERDISEYTRNKEGTEEHQRRRTERHHAPTRKLGNQSMTNMHHIHTAVVTFSDSNRSTYPSGIGETIEFLDVDNQMQFLLPWSKTDLPEGFAQWEQNKKMDFVDKNTGYVFLLAGQPVKLDRKRISLLELPTSDKTKTVSVMFEDRRGRVMPYDEADKLVKDQTGLSISAWRGSPVPGQATPPKQEEADEPKSDK